MKDDLRQGNDRPDSCGSSVIATAVPLDTNAIAATKPAAKRRSFYRPELDLLRLLGFSVVFVHHAFPHEPVACAAAGVPFASLRSWRQP